MANDLGNSRRMGWRCGAVMVCVCERECQLACGTGQRSCQPQGDLTLPSPRSRACLRRSFSASSSRARATNQSLSGSMSWPMMWCMNSLNSMMPLSGGESGGGSSSTRQSTAQCCSLGWLPLVHILLASMASKTAWLCSLEATMPSAATFSRNTLSGIPFNGFPNTWYALRNWSSGPAILQPTNCKVSPSQGSSMAS